jgi:putative transposase
MRPTAAQAEQLRFQAGARRWIWNWALARKRQYYEEHGKGIPTSVLKRELPKLKAAAETAWLKAADSQALQETLRDLDRAFTNFFAKRARFPRFKSRKREQLLFGFRSVWQLWMARYASPRSDRFAFASRNR